MLPRWFEMTLLHESVSLLNVLTVGNNWQTFILVGGTYGHLSQEVGFTGSIPTTPTSPTATIKKHSWAGVTLNTCGATSTQLNNGVVSSGVRSRASEQKALCWHMDKVMKRLEIELAIPGFEVVPIMHYNVDGRPLGGGRTS